MHQTLDMGADLAAELPTDAVEDTGVVDLGGSYRRTVFGTDVSIDPSRFHDAGYTGTIRAMIAQVVATEAPIRDNLLVERIARAHGFQRSGPKIRDRILALVRATAHLQVESGGSDLRLGGRRIDGALGRGAVSGYEGRYQGH